MVLRVSTINHQDKRAYQFYNVADTLGHQSISFFFNHFCSLPMESCYTKAFRKIHDFNKNN